jgi:uncharacterized phiE125 gp8 family phage protein
MRRMNEGADNWALKIFAEPAAEPITPAEAKAHLRVDFPDDDEYITALITVAREITEQRTNRALITQTWDYILDDFPRGDEIKLRKPSLQSVTSVNYTDSDGIERIMPTTDYVVDTSSVPGRIFLGFSKIWPVAILQPASAVRIRFIAGYGAVDKVPKALKQAMLLLIAQWYENREPVAASSRQSIVSVPMTYEYLIGPYKVVRLQ